MKVILKCICFGFVIWSLNSCSSSKSSVKSKSSLVHFEEFTGMEDILLKSTEKGKPVFVDFYTDWCVPCRIMDKEVFNDQATADYLNKHFVSVKINAEKGNGIKAAEKYFILGYPSLLFLDDQGDILISHLGSANNSLLLMLGDQALEKYRDNP